MKKLLFLSNFLIFSCLFSKSTISVEVVDSVNSKDNASYFYSFVEVEKDRYIVAFFDLFYDNFREVKKIGKEYYIDKDKYKNLNVHSFLTEVPPIKTQLQDSLLIIYYGLREDRININTTERKRLVYSNYGLENDALFGIIGNSKILFQRAFKGNAFDSLKIYKSNNDEWISKTYSLGNIKEKVSPSLIETINNKFYVVSKGIKDDYFVLHQFSYKDEELLFLSTLPVFGKKTEYTSLDIKDNQMIASGKYYLDSKEYLFLVLSNDAGKTWNKIFDNSQNKEVDFNEINFKKVYLVGNQIVAISNFSNILTSDKAIIRWENNNTLLNFLKGSDIISYVERIDEKRLMAFLSFNYLTIINMDTELSFPKEDNSNYIFRATNNDLEYIDNTDYIGELNVEFFDIQGRKISTFSFDKIFKSQLFRMNTFNFKGLYFVKVQKGIENYYHKIYLE
jgi:hypothetical protein